MVSARSKTLDTLTSEKKPNQENQNKKANNNIAAAYIRVSTEEQMEKKNSVEVQRKAAIALAQEEGYILDGSMIFEEAQPASKVYGNDDEPYNLREHLRKRPMLKKIVDLASQKKIGHLIIYTRDRLSRHLQTSLALIQHFKKNNVVLHYSSPGETINIENDAIEKFIEVILANVAELEANTLAIRAKAGNKYCVTEGYWPGGRIPFGYIGEKVQNGKKTNTKLVAADYEEKMVKEVFNYYTNGYSYREIAALMNLRHGSNIWTKSKVESILKNQIYTGHIVWDRRGGRRHPGKHDTVVKSKHFDEMQIISEDEWKETVYLRAKKTFDSKYYNSKYLLKGKLYCGICGQPLKPRNYGKNKDSVYRCPKKDDKTGLSELVVKQKLVEDMFIKEFIQKIEHQQYDQLWEEYLDAVEENRKKAKVLIREKNKLFDKTEENITKIEDILDKNIDEKIASFLRSKKIELIRYKEMLEKEIEHIKKEMDNYYSDKDKFIDILRKAFKGFNSLDHRKKRIMIDMSIDKIVINKTEYGFDMKIIAISPE